MQQILFFDPENPTKYLYGLEFTHDPNGPVDDLIQAIQGILQQCGDGADVESVGVVLMTNGNESELVVFENPLNTSLETIGRAFLVLLSPVFKQNFVGVCPVGMVLQ